MRVLKHIFHIEPLMDKSIFSWFQENDRLVCLFVQVCLNIHSDVRLSNDPIISWSEIATAVLLQHQSCQFLYLTNRAGHLALFSSLLLFSLFPGEKMVYKDWRRNNLFSIYCLLTVLILSQFSASFIWLTDFFCVLYIRHEIRKLCQKICQIVLLLSTQKWTCESIILSAFSGPFLSHLSFFSWICCHSWRPKCTLTGMK